MAAPHWRRHSRRRLAPPFGAMRTMLATSTRGTVRQNDIDMSTSQVARTLTQLGFSCQGHHSSCHAAGAGKSASIANAARCAARTEACEAMELVGHRSESVYRRLAIVAHGDPVEAYTPSRERRGHNRGHRGAVGSGLRARGAS